MSEWKEYKLGEIINLKRGHDLPASKRVEGRYPIVSSSGVTGWHNENKAKGPGVVTGRYGTIGEVFYVEGDYWPLNTTLYVQDFKTNLPKFIYYFLKTFNFHKYNDKSSVPGINRNHLHEEIVKIPELTTQVAIAEILSSLDHKIELNNKINQELESLAQLLFKRWFVDFEFPNENGEPYKSSGGKMVDSELGEIPKGWIVKSFLEISEIKLGGTPSSMKLEYWGGEIPWVNSGEINKNYIISGAKGITELGLKKSATKLIPKFSTLIAITGATLGQVSYSLIDACYNQSVVSITPDLNLSEYIHQYVLSNIDEITSHQTGGAQQHINKGDVEKTKLIFPNPQTLNQFSQKISSVYRKIENNLFENEKLTRLRDILLLKLISGELQINQN